jgi:hypothetical protein
MQESSLSIRKAMRVDAPRLHELHTTSVRALCSGHYAPEVIDGWLLNRRPQGYLAPIERGDIFVAEYGSTIVGFGEAVPGATSRSMSIRSPLSVVLALQSCITHWKLRGADMWVLSV